MRRLLLLLPILLLLGACVKSEAKTEVLCVISAPGLTVLNNEGSLEDYVVVTLTTVMTRSFFGVHDVEFVTMLSPLYDFEDPLEYQRGVILETGYKNGMRGMFPKGTLDED
jgi:hypothetical protein